MAKAPSVDEQLKLLDSEPEEEREAPQQLEPIPLHIPDSLWKPIEDEIKSFIGDEIAAAESERADFMRKLARWRKVYSAPMPEGPKNFPFFGASNLTIPIVKEAVNTLTAQLVQSTLTARPYWVLQDLASEWEPFIDEVETFMDLAGDRDLKLDENSIPWTIEAVKYGTSVMETGYEVDERQVYHLTQDGRKAFPKTQSFHDGPITYHVPIEDFFIRFGETSIQKARWVGKRLRMNEVQLREKEARNEFYNIDKVVQVEPEEPPENVQLQEEIEETEPTERMVYEIFEIWISYILPGDKRYTELQIYYHPATDTVIGRRFHPYWHGRRPFVKLVYFPIENRFYGEGLCEMLEQIQEAISARYNQRSDNITLANLKMFLKRRGVKGLQPGDPLYSGKQIEVLDVNNDIRELNMSEVYPSTFNEETLLRDYYQRLSGLNDAIFGSAMPVTRTTASAQLALLQEQAKRIDLTIRDIRKQRNKVGWFALQLYFQFGTNGKGVAWLGQRGMAVEGIFSLPKRVTELGLAIKAQVPTSLQNRQVKRENSLAMFNLLVQLYKELIPFAQALAPEQLPNVVHSMVKGAQKFVGDVLETFEVSDPEDVLAGLAVLERVLPAAEDLGGLESFARRAEAAEVLDKISGLEDLLKQAEAARRRDPGVSFARGDNSRVPPPPGQSSDIPEDIVFGG